MRQPELLAHSLFACGHQLLSPPPRRFFPNLQLLLLLLLVSLSPPFIYCVLLFWIDAVRAQVEIAYSAAEQ